MRIRGEEAVHIGREGVDIQGEEEGEDMNIGGERTIVEVPQAIGGK